MSMKLYLVQHGKALSKKENPERPLTQGGRVDAQHMGRFLKQANVSVGRMIHSGKLRAQQTAELLAIEIGFTSEPEVSGLLDPNDNPAAFDWQSESWDVDTLIVGHLPFMARLVSHLLINDQDSVLVSFQPGSVVCLEHREDTQWQVGWMICPELLAD
jgi:phosphohistidine phosphatase